jgi:hypothetical protein
MTTEIAVIPETGSSLFRVSTDAAGLCKDIVVATARNIQGRKYVQVEGWQAIAIAHGCTASSGEVKKTEEGGYSAIGKVIRMDTGMVIASAEGYVGPDEPTWFGGEGAYGKKLPKRPDYAIRAMAQTRAISRACRSAFAHVVVMMNAGLSTTPAEEVPAEGFDDHPKPTPMPEKVKQAAAKAQGKVKKPDLTIIEGEATHVRGTISGDPSEGDLTGIAGNVVKPSGEVISKVVHAFAQIGFTVEMLEKEYGKPMDQWVENDIPELRQVLGALKTEAAAAKAAGAEQQQPSEGEI